jgi:hypothetical protein
MLFGDGKIGGEGMKFKLGIDSWNVFRSEEGVLGRDRALCQIHVCGVGKFW